MINQSAAAHARVKPKRVVTGTRVRNVCRAPVAHRTVIRALLPFVYVVIVAAIAFGGCALSEAKVFERCELAQLLHKRHRLPLTEVANWVCIAQHLSGFNTAAYASSLTGGGSHGLFQISDAFWCSPPGKGSGCNVPCKRLRDDDLGDDLACLRIIHAEHQRISGNGYDAWNAHQQFCRHGVDSYIAGCFSNGRLAAASTTRHKVTHQTATTSLAVYHPNAIGSYTARKRGKIYGRCELAQELYYRHKMPMKEIPTWVCIAQYESSFDTAAVGRLNTDGSEDHGLFQISDLYWCSHEGYGGKACGLSCNKLLDEDISDDVRCIRRIHNEHTHLSGDGFNAWTVYERNCRGQHYDNVAACFKQKPPTYAAKPSALNAIAPSKTHAAPTHASAPQQQQQHYPSNPFFKQNNRSTPPKHSTTAAYAHTPSRANKPNKGKVYNRCELAQELYFKHKFPMQDIPTWVCIAQHESNFVTSAVGRLNGDGSADHGLFQISDLYWCAQDSYGGKGCGLSCHKLLDSDISDDVQCVRTIYAEHTRISGDGFTAWTVYDRNCRNQGLEQMAACFDSQEITKAQAIAHTYIAVGAAGGAGSGVQGGAAGKGKVYNRCELAQELYSKHKLPLDDIATWVCIAQHESNYDTSAVGRLNTDGSADHGLFQISDLYWCSHEPHGGKACNIPCHKLLDSDISDDVQCIKTIHAEHTRISGDGFTAWVVYNGHCRNQRLEHIANCFDDQQITAAAAGEHTASDKGVSKVGTGKVYKRCELAQELYFKHKMPMSEIPTWLCIVQHESNYDTSAVGRLNADGSADHGLFQISDLYWCSHEPHGGKACHIACSKLLDNDISDDVRCVRNIFEEHTRISGDGFTAWTVYNQHCRHQQLQQIETCFDSNEILKAQKSPTTTAVADKPSSGHKVGKGKVYKKCELAQELYFRHKMPMKDIPTWVCIAQYESNYNTAAVGRLNTDGSADHGLFQISDLYWCSHEPHGGKACNIACNKLLDNDIADDVRCMKTIHEEHTRISGDGFTAWTVYNPHCRNQPIEKVASCFDPKVVSHGISSVDTTYHTHTVISIDTPSNVDYKPAKKKIYQKCELAQELYFKHKLPMIEIPTWVCIVQYESSFDTSAVGRLNTDGSADHGLFQISDIYWCSHDQHGGKACNIPCHKLLDTDLTDDVRCVKIIYEEHTRISGNGFTAWTVYNRHCRNQQLEHVSSCFDSSELKKAQQTTNSYTHKSATTRTPTIYHVASTPNLIVPPKGPVNHAFVHNPFLNQFNASSKTTLKPPVQQHHISSVLSLSDPGHQPSYETNPFLQKFTQTQLQAAPKEQAVTKPKDTHLLAIKPNAAAYVGNPFLNKISSVGIPSSLPHKEKVAATDLLHKYNSNPFLAKFASVSGDTTKTISASTDATLTSKVESFIVPSQKVSQPQRTSPKATTRTTQNVFSQSTVPPTPPSTKSYINSNVFRSTQLVAPTVTTAKSKISTRIHSTTTNRPSILSTKPHTPTPTITTELPTTSKVSSMMNTKAYLPKATTTTKPTIKSTTSTITKQPITTTNTKKSNTHFATTTTRSPYLHITKQDNNNSKTITTKRTSRPTTTTTTTRPTTIATTTALRKPLSTSTIQATTRRPSTTRNWIDYRSYPVTTKQPTIKQQTTNTIGTKTSKTFLYNTTQTPTTTRSTKTTYNWRDYHITNSIHSSSVTTEKSTRKQQISQNIRYSTITAVKSGTKTFSTTRKPTTTWNWRDHTSSPVTTNKPPSKHQTTHKFGTTSVDTARTVTTTKKPPTTWNWRDHTSSLLTTKTPTTEHKTTNNLATTLAKTSSFAPTTTYTKRPTTIWNWRNHTSGRVVTTTKPTTKHNIGISTVKTVQTITTTKKPTTKWNWRDHTSSFMFTKKPTTKHQSNNYIGTTTLKTNKSNATQVSTTTKRPNTTWNWRHYKSSLSSTKKPTTNSQTTNNKSITAVKPKNTTTTNRPTTTRNWRDHKSRPSATTKTTIPIGTNANVNSSSLIVQKPTTKQRSINAVTTTTKRLTTSSITTSQKALNSAGGIFRTTTSHPNWYHTNTRATKKEPITNAKEPQTTKSTSKHTTTTTTTKMPRPTSFTTIKPKHTTTTTTARKTTQPTLKTTTTIATQRTTAKHAFTTFSVNTHTTTTTTTTKPTEIRKSHNHTAVNATKQVQQLPGGTHVDYNKYKHDPFSHPFFAKYNEQFELFRKTTTTTTTATTRKPHTTAPTSITAKRPNTHNPHTSKTTANVFDIN